MQKLKINYLMNNHGWATISFCYGDQVVEQPVSYLYDSLRDLALLALDVKLGKPKSRAVFMGEPGELQFRVSSRDDQWTFSVLTFSDWHSWGLDSEENSRLVLQAQTSANELVQQVRDILQRIHDELGPEQYRQRWVEHDFPIDAFHKLQD